MMKTILYIDDEPGLSELYKELLEGEGHSVWSALDGEEALQVLETKGSPHLILVDFNMPGMNGEEFMLEVKQRYPQLANVPVVGFTGHHGSSPVVATFKTVVTEIVQKPDD